MFEDAALKLRRILEGITSIIMVITAIAGFIVSVWLGQTLSYDGGSGIVLFGFLLTGIAVLLEWLQSLLIIAFCDMMVDIKAIRKSIDSKDTKNTPAMQGAGTMYGTENTPVMQGTEELQVHNVETSSQNTGNWVCVRCGNLNPYNALRCKCGVARGGGLSPW